MSAFNDVSYLNNNGLQHLNDRLHNTFRVTAGQNDYANLGNFATSSGFNTNANGEYSHAEGYYSTSRGNYSHAEGNYSFTRGNYSHAEGAGSAFGDYSHAEGEGMSDGAYSHAEGSSSASGNYAHAEGAGSASGQSSHAEGSGRTSGKYSHAEGAGDSTGNYSHAEGFGMSSGNYSHAEGYYAYAVGNYSHAEGNRARALGNSSHAEGFNTRALSDYSHAGGIGTIANAEGATVFGKYSNDSQDILFGIGNGNDNENRSSCFEITTDGFIRTGTTKIRFGVDANGNYGYIKPGADTVYPFKNPQGEQLITSNGVYNIEDFSSVNVQIANLEKEFIPIIFFRMLINGGIVHNYGVNNILPMAFNVIVGNVHPFNVYSSTFSYWSNTSNFWGGRSELNHFENSFFGYNRYYNYEYYKKFYNMYSPYNRNNMTTDFGWSLYTNKSFPFTVLNYDLDSSRRVNVSFTVANFNTDRYIIPPYGAYLDGFTGSSRMVHRLLLTQPGYYRLSFLGKSVNNVSSLYSFKLNNIFNLSGNNEEYINLEDYIGTSNVSDLIFNSCSNIYFYFYVNNPIVWNPIFEASSSTANVIIDCQLEIAANSIDGYMNKNWADNVLKNPISYFNI